MSEESEKIRCPNCAEMIQVAAISCRFCQFGLSEEHLQRCPFCSEMIRREAKLCRYCRSNLSQTGREAQETEVIRMSDQSLVNITPAPLAFVTRTEGVISGGLSEDEKYACILEIICETNSCSRNQDLKDLTAHIIKIALQDKPKTLKALLSAPSDQQSIEILVRKVGANLGENIAVRRFASSTLESDYGSLGLYVHPSSLSPMGAIVKIESNKSGDQNELNEIAREVTLHIVASKPRYISRGEISENVLQRLEFIESGKGDLFKKDPKERDAIVAQRVEKIVAQHCLLEQMFVKDPSVTVGQYLNLKGEKLGLELRPIQFQCFCLGEENT